MEIIQNKLHSHTCDALQQSILIVFYGTEEYQALATRTILGSIDLKTRGRIHSPLLTLLVPAAVLLLLFFFLVWFYINHMQKEETYAANTTQVCQSVYPPFIISWLYVNLKSLNRMKRRHVNR